MELLDQDLYLHVLHVPVLLDHVLQVGLEEEEEELEVVGSHLVMDR